jgi:hypothetical protein
VTGVLTNFNQYHIRKSPKNKRQWIMFHEAVKVDHPEEGKREKRSAVFGKSPYSSTMSEIPQTCDPRFGELLQCLQARRYTAALVDPSLMTNPDLTSGCKSLLRLLRVIPSERACPS